jgi:hypothetical protein
VSTRAFAQRAAACSGTGARLRRLTRWQLRLAGVFVPAVREMIEMEYEFEEDWVVDHTAYAAVLGDHATPLDTAIAATVAAQPRPDENGRIARNAVEPPHHSP